MANATNLLMEERVGILDFYHNEIEDEHEGVTRYFKDLMDLTRPEEGPFISRDCLTFQAPKIRKNDVFFFFLNFFLKRNLIFLMLSN